MDDLIRRQAAIDALMAWEEGSVWDEECLKHRGEPYWVAPSDVIEQLPSAQPEPQWIPCSERLPSKADHKDNMVLVCYGNGSVRFNTYMNGWVQGNPVAWMPLPESYKGE